MPDVLYKFTFEDGSEAYLQHYGVKGMKWKKHLKATDPEYLEQLGANIQGFAENVFGKASEGKEQAVKKLNEFVFRTQPKQQPKKVPDRKPQTREKAPAKSYEKRKVKAVVENVLARNSSLYRAEKDFNRINSSAAEKKKIIDSRKTTPVTYKNVVSTVNNSSGGVSEASRDVGKLVYNDKFKKSVDKAKTEAASTYGKYKTAKKQADSMSESERNALRAKQRKVNNARKKEDANRIRRLLGLPEK